MSRAFDIRTTPFSRWDIENAPDEPAHGYYARLVAAEGHSSVRRYSDGIDLNARYANPETMMDAVLRLPIDPGRKLRLRNATPMRRDDGVWLASERFNGEDFSFASRRCCPGCLHESPHHRAWWDIVPITDCPYHGHTLIDQDESGKQLRWWWPVMQTTPSGKMLAKPMPRVESQNGFAGYVIGRLGFDRAVAAPLLDGHDLGSVVDVCGLVGRLLSSPWSTDIPVFDRKMIEVGFQAMSWDAACFVEVVRAWVRANVPVELRTKGMGYVFDWFLGNRQSFSTELGAMLHRVLRRALALEGRPSATPQASDGFLQDEVSLTALAHRLGVSKKSTATIADRLGFLPSREAYKGLVQFDAAEADAIAYHVDQSMTRVQAARMLGLTAREIMPLVEAGIVREYSSVGSDGVGGFRYFKADLQAVIEKRDGLCSPSGHRKSATFMRYVKDHGISPSDLAKAILAGEYDVVEIMPRGEGFRRLRIACDFDLDSRKRLRVLQRPDELISYAEAMIELNITQRTLYRLRDEGWLLRREELGACKWLDRASVVRFGEEHRTAREFLPVTGMSLPEFCRHMAEHGVHPILGHRPKSDGGSVNTIYRYDDVAEALGLRQDPTRHDDPGLARLWEKARTMAGTLPPYLLLPTRLPVSGQIVANATRKIAFSVTYDADKGVLSFEGKRNASSMDRLDLSVSDDKGSIARLEAALVSLIENTPRRR